MIQKRLIDFNRKLEEMFEESASLERDDFSILDEANQERKQLSAEFKKQKEQIHKKHRLEISSLLARLMDLQKYCS